MTIVGAGYGLLFGYGVGVIASALAPLSSEFSLTVTQRSVVVVAALVAAFLCAPNAGMIADRFGRRSSLIAIGVVYTSGSLISAMATGFGLLVTGRFLIGLCLGASSFVAPMYLAEVSPPGRRGALVTVNQLMITFGIFLGAVLGFLLTPAGHWRVLLGLGALPAIALTLAMVTLPESPRWLFAQGKDEEASRTFRELGLAEEDRQEPAQVNLQWREVLGSGHRRLIILGVVLAVAVHLTGLDMAVYFAPTILGESGFGQTAATLGGTWVAGANLLMTVVTILVIDRLGRRPLFIGGVALMAVSAALLGVLYRFGLSASGWVVVMLAVFIAAAAVGPAGVFWTYVAELYPQRLRSVAL
ncbi:MAG: sugar porter family MFS transporter, partial [Pseudonocardiaceae bacterium]